VEKLIPLYVVVATVVLPVWLARRPRPMTQLKVLYATMLVLILVWGYLCIRVYPQYVHVE
jgi:hypothetical protein